jgi:hypothetical protein
MKTILWRWTLKRLRLAIDAADDWLHAEEIKFREARAIAAPAPRPIEFDRAKSAARERQIKKARVPRLRYQAGAWVRR